ncbi:unnamed protein product [Rotaria sp. Silwood2]|nr:unnamed protein product [Rotaria sp. Silwood2]
MSDQRSNKATWAISGLIQRLSMEQELYRAYNHVKETIEKLSKLDEKLHLAGSEQISSEKNITGPEIYKGNFGFLKLDDPNQTSFSDRLSQFIWLYNTTESFAVSRFIVEAYQLPPPHLILSIQTDYLNIQNSPCETFKLEGELVRAIQHGLVETIKITNAWIITNGINNIINRLVGEGLRDDVIGYDVPCIGLCNWSYEESHNQLVELLPLTQNSNEASHSIQSTDEAGNLEEGRASQDNEIEEPSSWLSQKCPRIFNSGVTASCLNADTTNELIPLVKYWNNIPKVVLLLGGNFTTLRALLGYLDNQTPIVVVRGTGGLADKIAYIADDTTLIDTETNENVKESEIKSTLGLERYNHNNLAINILKSKAKAFFGCFPLDIARHANCKAFLASDTVQKYISQKWYHRFDDQRQFLKMHISIWVGQ